jgi:hypothetical protein
MAEPCTLGQRKESAQQVKENKQMKQTTILNMSVLLVLAGAANAEPPDEGKTCSNETLKGSYGGVISGTRPAPFVFPGGPGVQGQTEQTIGLILWVFDGEGGFTQNLSGKGSIAGPTLDLLVSGTYSVNANCTATVTSIIGGVPVAEIRMVIVDGGKEFRTFVVSPQPTMIVGHARRVN